MSDENIEPINTIILNTKFWLKFDGQCIQQIKVNFNHKAILNFYIAYKVNIWAQYVGVDFALRNLFFYLVKLAENAYCIQHVWIFFNVGWCWDRSQRNNIVDMSSHVHVDNKKRS